MIGDMYDDPGFPKVRLFTVETDGVRVGEVIGTPKGDAFRYTVAGEPHIDLLHGPDQEPQTWAFGPYILTSKDLNAAMNENRCTKVILTLMEPLEDGVRPTRVSFSC